MNSQELSHLMVAVSRILQNTGANYCLIGGLAVVMHGHVRATRDIDFLVENLPDWEPVLEASQSLGLQLREQDRELADEGLLFLRASSAPAFGVDLLRVESAFESEILKRVDLHTVEQTPVPVI